MLTFPHEVSLVWPTRLTLVKVLFLLTRYIPFIDGGILIYCEHTPLHTSGTRLMDAFGTDHVQPFPKVEICDSTFKAALWLFLVGKAFPASSCPIRHGSEIFSGPECLVFLVILTLRTWGVWNRDRRLSLCLPVFFIVCWGSMVGFIVIFLNSVHCTCTFRLDLADLTICLVPSRAASISRFIWMFGHPRVPYYLHSLGHVARIPGW